MAGGVTDPSTIVCGSWSGFFGASANVGGTPEPPNAARSQLSSGPAASACTSLSCSSPLNVMYT